MNDTQLKTALAASDRWGVNWQPSSTDVLDVLRRLPVEHVEILDRDILYIKTYRPLTASEAYSLARLYQDSPEKIADDQCEFTLWWD